MPSQQRIQWARFRITVVFLVAVAILSVLVFLMSGGTWLKPKTFLTTHIPDATGVEPDADVQLNGVLIGKVTAVKLTQSHDPNRIIEVQLKIESSYLPYIPDDSVTEIDSANLLGDKYIDILMGTSPNHVRPNAEIRYKAPTNMMQGMDLQQFGAQLKTIDQLIADIQDGKGPLGEFFATDALYRQFVGGIIQIEKRMHAAVSTQTQLGQALYQATMHENALRMVKEIDDQLAQIQANPMLRSSAQYDQVRDQLIGLRNTLVDLNAGKGPAGQMLVSDAAYHDWSARLKGFIQMIDDLNSGQGSMGQMLVNANMYESLNGSMQELAHSVKEFREHPQKYLRLRFKLF